VDPLFWIIKLCGLVVVTKFLEKGFFQNFKDFSADLYDRILGNFGRHPHDLPSLL
jgi:hypothetical protein